MGTAVAFATRLATSGETEGGRAMPEPLRCRISDCRYVPFLKAITDSGWLFSCPCGEVFTVKPNREGTPDGTVHHSSVRQARQGGTHDGGMSAVQIPGGRQ